MENMNKWLMMNKLKLNENKTKLVEINMDNNIYIIGHYNSSVNTIRTII